MLQEVEEAKMEVEEIPIDVINVISWDIDHLSVQTMKRKTSWSTCSARRGRRHKPSDHGRDTRDRRIPGNEEGVVETSQRSR